MARFIPVQNDKSLPQAVVQQIEHMIRQKTLKPGDQLPPEKELAEELGVSRTVVREAIVILRQANVLEVRHGVGTFVTEPLPEHALEQITHLLRRQVQSVYEVHEVRAAFEPQLVAIAVDRIVEEELETLRQVIAEMEASINDMQRFIELDLLFHDTIIMATKNNTFRLILNPIMEVLLEIRKLGSAVDGAAEQTIRDHKEVLKAIESKDRDLAQIAMTKHLANVAENVRTAEQAAIQDDLAKESHPESYPRR